MKFSMTLCGGITAVSGLTLPFLIPERIYQAAASAPALPLSAFPKFETVKLQDAQQAAAGDSTQENPEVASTKVAEAGNRPAPNDGNIHQNATIASSNPEAAAPQDPAADDSTNNTANSSSDNTPANAQKAQALPCGTPSPRPQWRAYPARKQALVDAIACLQSRPPSGDFAPATSRYEDFVRLHQAWTPNIHNNDLFLLWHRYFVWSFEQALRTECGFAADGLPWWDETRDAGRFAAAPVFTAEYFGSLPRGNGTEGTCVTDGRFAGTTLHIGPGAGSEPHCLSRAVDESMTAEVSKDYENTCLSRSTYTDFARCWEQGPHGIGHNSIGSVMADVRSSPGDPVFWLHHLYVDRVFAAWQARDATGARRRTVAGCADGARPCTPLTLQTLVPMGGLQKDVTVGEVLDTTDGAMCYTYQ
ncbi:Di-copper centre-containing protein [Apiospora phragmitis]|uniref:Di-copper centre-containing protein n=1 Tax=Apiospora phragmitis TaxID=2905665 RepID=A0ABR1W603_9PEZI